MDNQDGKTYYGLGLDNKQLQEDAKQSMAIIRGIGDSSVAEGARIDNAYKKAFEGVSKYGITSKNQLEEAIASQRAAISKLEEQYRKLNAAFYNTKVPVNQDSAFIEQRMKAMTLLQETSTELNREKQALNQLESAYKKVTNEISNSDQKQQTFITQLRHIKQEMMQIVKTSLENGTNYKENERYKELEAQLQKLGIAYKNVGEAQKTLVNPQVQFAGVMSGLSGLSGAFSAATGVMGLFSGQNENLAKVQAKLQSVMAITIGLQAVSSTMLQTSAFRTATVTKAKNLLTAANTRLAVSLGISNAAATALMATLTLGLSAVVAGLVILWNKYSDAQQEAAKKARERVETESDGRAQMVKTRFEIEHTVKSLKDFTGSKEQEKEMVEQLNRKYGESFGYYDTASQWYDVLIQKSDAYIQMLFLQAKAQSLVNKAVEADEKANLTEAAAPDDVEGAMGWFARMGLYTAQAMDIGRIDARREIEEYNRNAKDAAVKAAEEQRDAYLDEARKLQEEYANLRKEYSIGGFVSARSTSAKNKSKDYTDQLKQEEQEKIRFYKDMEFAVRQARIDASDEGLGKILAQNKLNFDKEMEQIKRQDLDKLAKIQAWERTIWESENPDWEKKGMKFSPKTTQSSDEDNEQLKVLETGVEAKFTANNQKAYEEALNEYARFAQKYLDKVKEFNDNIKNLEKQGATTETIESVKAMQAEILAGLDEEMEIKEQTFITFVEGMVGMGLEQLLEALDKAKDALDAEIASGEGDKAKVNQLKAQVKTLTARINELTAVKDDTKEVKTSDPSKKWKDTLSVMQDVKSLTNDIANSFEGLDDATKAVLDAAMNIATGVINMIIGINTLAVGSATATTMTATTAAEAIKGVEKASVILAIISAALQIAMAIANLITNIFSGDKKKEKEIQRLQKQVDTLRAAYDKLGKAIDKAYSTNAANLIEQQDANLRRQKKLLEEQIRLEEDKKKTDKNKVQQYKDAIKEIDDELERTHDKIVEAIIGQDISSAIDEFAEAYIDAWAAGEEKATSIKEVVRKMVKSAVAELVKSRLSPEVTAFMDYLATAMEDGILTIAEQNTLDALENAIDNKLNGLDDSLDKYVKDKEADGREGSKKGIATASQESVDENNGRLTAIQGHTYSLTENMKILVTNTGTILILLSGIEENTKGISRLESIEKDIQSIKNTMNDIALKGIIIKR
ncbi:MAG: hypothetical protein LBG18_09230 [Mediterranea sp.]|jgi:hypothetical protein|nr:hypothetical protein [Mediterranea sp.]